MNSSPILAKNYKTVNEFIKAHGTPTLGKSDTKSQLIDIWNKVNNTPIVYHGTFAEFEKFDKNKLGNNTESPSAYQGFFFASNEKVAISYASNIRKRLRDCEEIKQFCYDEIKKLTDDSYFDSIFKYVHKKYGNDINNKLTELYDTINTCDDYEAGVEDFPIAYDSDLAETGKLKKVRLIINNPFIYDMKGNDYREVSYINLIIEAKSKGYDSVIIENTYDGGDPVGSLELTDIYIVFDESQIIL
jgi:hypothetical protein